MSANALPDSPDADRRRYAAAAPVVEGFIDNLIEFYRGGELALPNITQLLWVRSGCAGPASPGPPTVTEFTVQP
jgi:hypothetical protein